MKSGVALLKEIQRSCTDTERRIAEYLIENPKTAVFCTITELARRAGTNPPAVIRLCKRAGLSGYRELQLLLTRDLYSGTGAEDPPPVLELDSNLTVETIAQTIVSRTKDAVERVLSLLNPQSVEAAVREILSARSVALFGSGASANVGYDLFQKLSRVGIPCSFSFDTDVQMTTACGLTNRDIAFAISYSGKTGHTIAAAKEAKKSEAGLISLTSANSGPLARLSDIVLQVPLTEPLLRTGASLSRATQLLMVDILYTTIVCRSIEQSVPRIERSMRAVHKENSPLT